MKNGRTIHGMTQPAICLANVDPDSAAALDRSVSNISGGEFHDLDLLSRHSAVCTCDTYRNSPRWIRCYSTVRAAESWVWKPFCFDGINERTTTRTIHAVSHGWHLISWLFPVTLLQSSITSGVKENARVIGPLLRNPASYASTQATPRNVSYTRVILIIRTCSS